MIFARKTGDCADQGRGLPSHPRQRAARARVPREGGRARLDAELGGGEAGEQDTGSAGRGEGAGPGGAGACGGV